MPVIFLGRGRGAEREEEEEESSGTTGMWDWDRAEGAASFTVPAAPSCFLLLALSW